MKKTLFLLTILSIQFLFIVGVKAEGVANQITCDFIRTEDKDSYSITYEVKGNDVAVIDCNHEGSSCMGDKYKHLINITARLGTNKCPGSINVTKEKDVTTIKTLPNNDGIYKNGQTWGCLYIRNSANYKDGKISSFSVHVPFYAEIHKINNEFSMYVTKMCEEAVIQRLNNVSNKDPMSIAITSAFVNKYCKDTNKIRVIGFDDVKNKLSDLSEKNCPVFYYKNSNSTFDIYDAFYPNGFSRYEYPKGNNGLAKGYLAVYDDSEEIIDLPDESVTCLHYYDKTSCENKADKVACVWTENKDAPRARGGYCNVDNLLYVYCGGAYDIPIQIPGWISLFVNLLKIATPIVLIFVSVFSLVKALASSKEDEIKKAQSSLIKKMIAAVMVFFIIAIVQFVISKVADDEDYKGFTDCMDCFLNNRCSESSYYKTSIAGDDYCTFLGTGEPELCDDFY